MEIMKEFNKWKLRNIYQNAWDEMSLCKRLHIYLEWWCSTRYGAWIVLLKHEKLSPSGLPWNLYELPWYAKYVAKLEFQVRYLIYPRPEIIVGFFPFYRRKKS
jgi:hypothetical protein